MQTPGAETAALHSSPAGGKLIILTAPLTEIIDHAGFFIQMGMASMPVWMEGVLNRRYPRWRELDRNEDGSAQIHACRHSGSGSVAASQLFSGRCDRLLS